MRSHPPKIGPVVLAASSVVAGFCLIVGGLFHIAAGGLWMVSLAVGVGFAAGGLVALVRRPRPQTGFDIFLSSSGLSEKEAAAAWSGIREELFQPNQDDIRAATRALLVSIEDELRREEALRKARRRPCRRNHLRRRKAASFRSIRRPDRTMIRQGLGS